MRTFIAHEDPPTTTRFWRATADEMALLESVRAQIVQALLAKIPADELVWQICRSFDANGPSKRPDCTLDDAQQSRCLAVITTLDEAVDRDVPDDVLGATCADAVRVGELLLETHRSAFIDGYAAGVSAVAGELH